MGLDERENKRKRSIVGSMIDSTQNDADENLSEDEDVNDNSLSQQFYTAPQVVPKEKEETRSKRVNLLIQPSVYQKAQKKCKKMGISINECINQLLNNWVQ